MTFIPTDAPPSAPARKVGEFKPDLLLTPEHHLCPGCGEPLALRILLETIQELGVADRTIAVPGIGCYTSFSSSIDVDLVQALHGRAPSVATGVKRMLPDRCVFTLQGDGDMVNEGLQEVIHTAARGEAITCVLLEQRRVRRDRRAHDGDQRDRPAHQELARRSRPRLPRLPHPDRQPARASCRARRTSRAARCTPRARWPGPRR